MNDRQYFLTTSLSYQLKAARQELSSFRSGDAYTWLRAEYESIIRDLNHTIKKLQKERDDISFSRCTFRINGSPFPRQRCKRPAPAVRYPFVVTC